MRWRSHFAPTGVDVAQMTWTSLTEKEEERIRWLLLLLPPKKMVNSLSVRRTPRVKESPQKNLVQFHETLCLKMSNSSPINNRKIIYEAIRPLWRNAAHKLSRTLFSFHFCSFARGVEYTGIRIQVWALFTLTLFISTRNSEEIRIYSIQQTLIYLTLWCLRFFRASVDTEISRVTRCERRCWSWHRLVQWLELIDIRT